MSKELKTLYTPLQSLNNIRYNYFHNKGGSELEYFWFNRVETALKENEELRKDNEGLAQCVYALENLLDTNRVSRYNDLPKKLKALEIIKEYFVLTSEYGKVSLEPKKFVPEDKVKKLKEVL